MIVGLTGGIGSGKTTASRIFAELGAEVIDTDIIAHQLTAPGQPALAAINNEMGPGYLTADGMLDRAALRRRIFNEPAAKKALENILHPLIRHEVGLRIEVDSNAPYRMVVVPLLFETGGYSDIIHRSLLIDCPEEMQITRATARSQLTTEEVKAIIASQISRADRMTFADDVILNDGTLENLTNLVTLIHKKYIRLA